MARNAGAGQPPSRKQTSMQPGDVSEGVSLLADAIIASGIIPLLDRLQGASWAERPAPAALLACYASFAAALPSFGRTEGTILRELDIAGIADVDWWAGMVLAVAAPVPAEAVLAEVATLATKLRFVADTLPNLLPTLARDSGEPGTEAVQILLLAESGHSLHPLRLSYAIESVCTLWDVVCDIEGDVEPLCIVACDPGFDMAVTFRGPKLQVAALRTLLMHVWERIVVSHDASLEERIAAIPRTLPVMERIGAASPAALTLRRAVEHGVRLFLEAGACMPEMDDPARFTPARLLHVSDALVSRTFADAAPLHLGRGSDDASLHGSAIVEGHPMRPGLPKPFLIGKSKVG